MIRRPLPGGGVRVEVEPDRLVGWINRFAARNQGLASVVATSDGVLLTGGDGTTARGVVPFGPMAVGDREPVEAVLDHLHRIGPLGAILARAGAHSVGLIRDGTVANSSTHRGYVQGRTAAGGWSQQRFARRRGNQRAASLGSAADTAARLLTPEAGALHGLILGGDREGLSAILGDPRLAALQGLPTREFPDIGEPRRAVLDEVAKRSLTVEISVTPPADRESS